jgi:hypothetical protein
MIFVILAYVLVAIIALYPIARFLSDGIEDDLMLGTFTLTAAAIWPFALWVFVGWWLCLTIGRLGRKVAR